MKLLPVSVLLLCASCAHATQDLRPIVMKKAAFELACGEDQLKITELGDSSTTNMAGAVNAKTFGVEGCGKRASYQASCVKAMMMNEMCNAVQTSMPVAAPAAAPAP